MPVVPALFVKYGGLFPLYVFVCFVKDQLPLSIWLYFWVLYSVPLVYMPVFIPVLCCFGNYILEVIVGSQVMRCLQIFLFALYFFVYAGFLLLFHVNFRIVFSSSMKNDDGILMGITLNL